MPTSTSRWGRVRHESSPSISGEQPCCLVQLCGQKSPLSRQSHGWGLVALQINLQIQWQPPVLVQRRVHLRSKAGKQDLQAFGGTRTRQVEVYQTIQTGKHMRRSQLSCFPGSLFNPWDSGKARNWFQPGSGQPTSIPEVKNILKPSFGRLLNLIPQVGLQEGAGWLPSPPPQPRLPPPVPRGPPVPMVNIFVAWK